MAKADSNLLVLTPSASSAFRSVLRGISHFAQRRGWSVRVIDTDRSNSTPIEMVRAWNPLGCITYYLNPREVPDSVPSVHVNPTRRSAEWWTVCHDSSSTGELAAREMLAIGMENFAFVGTAAPTDWSRQRGDAFESALATLFPASHCGHGALALRPSIRHSDPVADQRALTRWLATLPRPCGIFAANDRIAELVIAAARSAKLAIPDDLAVIGADNDEQTCENVPVSLTSIAPNFIRGGELACELLEERLCVRGRQAKSITYGDLGVVHRASTRRQRRQNAMVAEMQEFIRKNAASGISAFDVAARCPYSRRTAELAFRAATGHSIGQELVDARLEIAIRNLADPTLRIGEISSLVGYVSQNQLERVFRRKFGCSMLKYRHIIPHSEIRRA